MMAEFSFRDLSTMDTQQAVDALTDHMAIYHRSAGRPEALKPPGIDKKTNSKSGVKSSNAIKQKVIEWFSGLSTFRRQAALTIFDRLWVMLLLQMQQKLNENGPGRFIILPDMPSSSFVNTDSTSSHSSKQPKGKDKKGRASTNSRRARSSKGSKMSNGVNLEEDQKTDTKCGGTAQLSNSKAPLPDSISLPGLCYRKANGLLARLNNQLSAEEKLLKGVKLYSSQDGEKGLVDRLSEPALDSLIVAGDLAENFDLFLEVMEEISDGEFLEHPLGLVASPWEETPWLQAQGYYSVAAYIVNKLEIAIWSSYIFSTSSKRSLKNGLTRKTNESMRSTRIPGRCIDVLESAAVAQSLHGKKQGCVDWWDRVPGDVKERVVRAALVAATKLEVTNAVSFVRNAASNAKPAKKPPELFSATRRRGRSLKWTSLSDTEADQYASSPRTSIITPTLPPLLAGLAALKEAAELHTLSGGASSLLPDSGGLSFSNLKSVLTLTDRIARRSRNVLARVMNEAVESELLEGEVGTKPMTAESVRVGDNKGSKDKKKRRKRSSVQKIAQDGKVLVDLDRKSPEEGERVRKEDVEATVSQSQKANIPNEIVGSPDFRAEKVQNSKSPIRKSRIHKHGKHAQAGASVDNNHLYDDKCRFLDKSRMNDSHESSYEISESKSAASFCRGDVDTIDTNSPISSTVEVPSEVNTDLCDSTPVLVRHSGDGVVSDADDKPHGSIISKTLGLFDAVEKPKFPDRNGHLRQSDEVKTRVLSPVGEEPTVGLSEAFEASTGEQDIEESIEKPADDARKCGLESQSMEHKALQLRFGTIDVIASDVQVSLNVKSSTTWNASALQRTVPDLQVLNRAASENGHKKNGSNALRIEAQEVGLAAGDTGATSEPVQDRSTRRSGLRSQSLPAGVCTPGKLFMSRHTPAYFTEEPVLVHNIKGGSLRSQHVPAFAMFYSHEWPGYSQVQVSGNNVRPTALDRLHLDGVHDLPKRLSASAVSISNPTPAPGCLDWPPFVHNGYSLPPVVGYSALNDPKVVTLSPFTSSLYASRTPPNGQIRLGDETEVEERLYDTDLEIFEPYAGEFEDFDGYVVSEEEGERQMEDNAYVKDEDYHQVFGGGVMYWNSADYTGMGYSRPGSMNSDDSSWARREADLGAVLDDIVGIHALQGPYRGKGSTNSNLSNTSPSQPSTSLPVAFDQIGSSQVGPRVCLTRSTGSDFAVNYGSISDDSQAPGPNVGNPVGVVDGIMSDGFMPRLRPIVVVRDPGLSRSMVKNDFVRLREARSPHITSRGVQDFSGSRRRRPSPPVIRHAPPPPPPSPVAGSKRRKGWMSARSGSSSPRHWGLTSWWNKDDVDNFDVQAVNRDTVVGNGRRKPVLASTPPIRPLSGAVRREHLVAMPPLTLDQEHMADEALVMRSSALYSNNPTLHLAITLFYTALHKEIETFCVQVAAEKRLRMPFINTAVKKVAHSLQVLWPRSRAKIFGSNSTGLALPTSDVDLVVSLPPVRKAREPIKQAGILEGRIDGVKDTCLLHAARNLEDQDWVKSLQVIEHTMVPLIRLKAHILPHQCQLGDISLSVKETCPMGTSSDALDGSPTSQCSGDSAGKEGLWGSEKDRQIVLLDISFEAPTNTGLRTSELVRELMGQFPHLTPLALILKQFLADRSLDNANKGGLSSYCQVLLITRYLQHQQHLGQPSLNENLGLLFMDFLHFFGHVFDPRSMCVRIRSGGQYVSRDRGPSIDPLYIEDPFDFENNVGSTCFRIQQIVKAFVDAVSILEKELFEASATDVSKGEESFNLLQKIIPSFVGK